ncbi:hypothetical protein Hdeb2414_s0018g00530281 [Helianthus debilis subsp. tardiflorus]
MARVAATPQPAALGRPPAAMVVCLQQTPVSEPSMLFFFVSLYSDPLDLVHSKSMFYVFFFFDDDRYVGDDGDGGGSGIPRRRSAADHGGNILVSFDECPSRVRVRSKAKPGQIQFVRFVSTVKAGQIQATAVSGSTLVNRSSV